MFIYIYISTQFILVDKTYRVAQKNYNWNNGLLFYHPVDPNETFAYDYKLFETFKSYRIKHKISEE